MVKRVSRKKLIERERVYEDYRLQFVREREELERQRQINDMMQSVSVITPYHERQRRKQSKS